MKVSVLNNRSAQNSIFTKRTLTNNQGHWFIRYKVYHLLFWVIYHYLWTVVNLGNPVGVLGYIVSSPKFIFYVIFQAMAVYFNLYFLIPRYLEKGRFTIYLFYLAITTVVAASLIVTGYYLTAFIKGSTLLEVFGNDKFSHFFITYTLPSTLTSMFLAMSIKLTKNWIRSKRREQLLEKEKLDTELKFLRSQLNPHFLFNSINSIFVLIHKNPDLASEALAKFSDLLRYQLYECNELEIPLTQELDYLESYIELERLRLDNKTVQLTIEVARPSRDQYSIAPFVLLPFIENAFKHVSTTKDNYNWIDINLAFFGNTMKFNIANSVNLDQKNAREVIRGGGIGLPNVQRRLNLLYPDEYKLNIEQGKDCFKVTIEIQLRQQALDEKKNLQIEQVS